jgi:hypothetical protein
MRPALSFYARITYDPQVIATKLMHLLIGIGLCQGCSGIALSQTAVGNSFRRNAHLHQHILDIISILFRVMLSNPFKASIYGQLLHFSAMIAVLLHCQAPQIRSIFLETLKMIQYGG